MEPAVKVIFILSVAQLLLVAAGHPRVGCFYLGAASEHHGTLYPEDIDASICSHLLYFVGSVNYVTGEIQLNPMQGGISTGGEGFIPRLVKLKAVNPDLKLILYMSPDVMYWIQEPSNKNTFLRTGIKWLNESGFDGFQWPLFMESAKRDKAADAICDMRPEFEKYGYMMSALVVDQRFPDSAPGEEGTISKLARCCDYATVIIEEHGYNMETYRSAPMSVIKSGVEWFIQRGLPASKIKFIVPTFGVYVVLEDPDETELGAKYIGAALAYKEFPGWNTIRYKELLKELNNSTLGWTFRRDNETQEPYAFSNSCTWTSYEDASSVAFKARYVLQRGLMGVDMYTLDLEDYEGFGEEGKFPLTRAVYNAFRRGNESLGVDP